MDLEVPRSSRGGGTSGSKLAVIPLTGPWPRRRSALEIARASGQGSRTRRTRAKRRLRSGEDSMATGQRWYKVLYVQVLIAIVLGVLLGWLAPDIAKNDWINFLGRAFVKLIKMAIAPIIFCTIVSGIAHIQEAKSVGRVGVKALVYFEFVSTLALLIGIGVGLLWQPGAGFPVKELTPDAGRAGQMLRRDRRQDEAGRLSPAHHSRQRRRRLRQFARGRRLPARRAAGVPDRRHPAGAVLRGAVRLRADAAGRARPCAARPDRRRRARDVRRSSASS